MVQPIDAATLIITRNSSNGLEILMLKRNKALDFAAGAYVFPGGKVEAEDYGSVVLNRIVLDGIPTKTLDLIYPNHPHYAIAFMVAAIRETFEETGLLLATDYNDKRDPSGKQLKSLHNQMINKKLSFEHLLQELDLHLLLYELTYFSHWITPELARKRFSARFFLKEFDQEYISVTPDDSEIVKHLWITPQKALQEYKKGNLPMILPTYKNIEEISSFNTINEIITYTKTKKITPILPKVIFKEQIPYIQIQDDEVLYNL